MTPAVVCPCGMEDCTEASRPGWADDVRRAIAYIAANCKEDWQPGEVAWFEYHCNESPDSDDAPIWYRSHQQVTVLGEGDNDGWVGSTFIQRSHACTPRTYQVRFADGLEWSVFEDELLTNRDAFDRPDPPKEPRMNRCRTCSCPLAEPHRWCSDTCRREDDGPEHEDNE